MPFVSRSVSAAFLLFFGWVSVGIGPTAVAQPVPGQVLVKYRDAGGGPRLQGARRVPAGARVVKSLALPGWQLIELPPDQRAAAAVAWFRRQPDVLAAEPNFRYGLHAAPNDPELPRLYGLERLGTPTAWDRTTGSSNIVVAVVDTGANLTHPDLVPNLWHNPWEIPGNGLDDDNNGWIDDVHGVDVVDGDGDPSDDMGHGTHVAGTIGAAGNNARGVVGVCWQVQLMIVRVGALDGFATTAELVSAFDYMTRMRRGGVNLRVANCSWGGPFPSAALKEAICAAGEAGILIVCSAGNDRQDNDALPAFPSGYDCPEIVSVAASNPCDEPVAFSNIGRTTVDVAAPGSGVLSTFRGGERYAVLSGTSMAAPHVAGAAALVLAAHPELSAIPLRSLLLTTVDGVPSWEGKTVTGGRINVDRALERAGSGGVQIPKRETSPPLRVTGVSRSSEGRWGNGVSGDAALSADGRWVAFVSAATNLVAGDREGFLDVFLQDRETGSMVRVSQLPDGTGAAGDCAAPTIGADGRHVAFVSSAANLVAGDVNGLDDVFVWDRATGGIELVSVRIDGRGSGNGVSDAPSISADGNFVAFASEARDLVPGDRNAARDIFVRNRRTGSTERVSLGVDGEARGWSDAPSISADGQVVAFHSSAANLVAGDRNTSWDIFVRDRAAGLTEWISQGGPGGPAGDKDSVFPVVSGDGRFVGFSSLSTTFDTRLAGDWLVAFVHDRRTGNLVRMMEPADAPGNGLPQSDRYVDALSADGRYVTITSDDPGLSPGGALGFFRTYAWDRATETLELLGVSDAGYAPDDSTFYARLSADGRFVTAVSYAFGLTPGDGNGTLDVFRIDRGEARPDLGVRRMGDATFAGIGMPHPKVPQLARQTLAAGQTGVFEMKLANGGGSRAFVLRADSTPSGWRVRASHPGGAGEIAGAFVMSGWTTPDVPAGGHLVFRIEIEREAGAPTEETVPWRVAVRATVDGPDLDAVSVVAHTVLGGPGYVLVSRGADGLPAERNAEAGAVSADGSRYVFSSDASHLDARGDANLQSDVFLADLRVGAIERVSDASLTIQGNADSRYPTLSADGRQVVFQARADNLVLGDTNGVEDVFVRDLATGEMRRITTSAQGVEGNHASEGGFMAAGGRFVAFTSLADNLVPGDDNLAQDVFVRDLQTGTIECVSRSSTGAFGNADSERATLTSDGRFVLFTSQANNLGPTDANGFDDVYLWDRERRTMELISANASGAAADGPSGGGSISDDGRWVTFFSYGRDLAPGSAAGERRAYLRDRASGRLELVSGIVGPLPDGLAVRGAIVSGDGRWLAVAAGATCGASAIPDQVLAYDRVRARWRAVSGRRDGRWGDDHSLVGRFGANSRFLAFESHAPNLRLEPGYPASQVYLADLADEGVDVGEPPRFTTTTATGSHLRIEWTGGGELESGPTPGGPWAIELQAVSPHTMPVAPGARYFRVVRR